MEETLVFIDEGFLSKISKFFGGGKYLKFDKKRKSEFSLSNELIDCCEKYFKLNKRDLIKEVKNDTTGV